MSERFLQGGWAAYEGLIYPTFDEVIHVVEHEEMESYLNHLIANGVYPYLLEGYDHGIAQPACYGLGFTDLGSNVHILDGFYQAEKRIEELAADIKAIRRLYAIDSFDQRPDPEVYADPQIFKRSKDARGATVYQEFLDAGVRMTRGANSIAGGINKINTYLVKRSGHRNPYTGEMASPHIFVSNKLQFFINEIVDYYWKKNPLGEREDQPTDRNDHAMDMLKYLMTPRKSLATAKIVNVGRPAYMTWQEIESSKPKARYG